MPEHQSIRLPFPVKGLDKDKAFTDQESMTTPDCQNVLPYDYGTGRLRGGQRPGLSKYVSSQITGTSSIQELIQVVGPNFDSAAGDGQMVIANPTSAAWGLVNSSGSTFATGGTSSYVYASSCWDQDANVYVAMRHSSTSNQVTFAKYNSAGTEQWSQTVTHGSTSTDAVVEGMVAIYPYIFIAWSGTSAPYDGKITRHYQSDGTRVDANEFYDITDHGTTFPPRSTYPPIPRVLAATTSHLGVTVYDTSIGERLRLIVLNPDSAEVISNTSVILDTATFNSMRGGSIEPDWSGNFIVGVTVTGPTSGLETYTIASYDSTGSQNWQKQVVPSGGNSNHGINYSLAYDGKNDRVAVVSSNANTLGTGNSLVILDNADGTVSSSSDPDSSTDWKVVLPDADGGFRLCRDSSGNTIIKLNSDLSTIDWRINTDTDDQEVQLSINTRATASAAGFGKRYVRHIAVAAGSVKRFDGGNITTAANGDSALSTRPVVFGAIHTLDVYFADGENTKYWDSATNQVNAWTASAGSFPVDSDGNYPLLIETWQGRIVQSGLLDDPHNWFMTAIGSTTDFDYSPATTSATQAVSGNNSDAGELGDVIRSMIPYENDLLIFGGDHSIWQMTGNPAAGGRLDEISDITGMAFGRPWCRDNKGAIWFFGSRGGLYRLMGSEVERISSTSIDEDLSQVNTGTNAIRMVWDDRLQGIWITISPLDVTSTTTHYFFDMRNLGFFPVNFANTDHNPKVLATFDGDAPTDRVILLGSWDGYVRQVDLAADDDDGSAIDSYTLIGPIKQEMEDPIILTSLSGVVGSGSNDVTFSVLKGNTSEAATTASAAMSGTWSAGRNYATRQRIGGHAMFVKVQNSNNNETWSLERIDADIRPTSRRFRERF